jgi:hypothetical protein
MTTPNPPSVDIKDLLVAAEIGTFAASSGWGIFIGEMPDKPDTAITVYDTGGMDPNPAFAQDQPAVMVKVRTAPGDYLQGWARAHAIKNALLGLPSQTINGTRYVLCNMKGDINQLGRDESRRMAFSLNFQLIREPDATGTHRE